MRFPGEILVKHRWIVLFALFVVVAGIYGGANESAYEEAMEHGPEIPWENVPQSALTLFFWNMLASFLSLFIIGLFLPFPFARGIGLGTSIGIGLWIISQNPFGIVMFSHGILELYSAFLALIGGLLVLAKFAETIWCAISILLDSIPREVNLREAAEEYGSLFLFSVTGLFVSAWMEAFLGYVSEFGVTVFVATAIVNTVISVLLLSYFNSSTIRSLVMKKIKSTGVSARVSSRDANESP